MAEGRRAQIRRVATATVCITVLFAGAQAALASMLRVSMEDLTKEADVIVTGDIKKIESRWDPWRTMIYTYITLSVDRYIKGTGEETLTVITEGGEADGYGIWVEDMPEFSKNEKVLVFLKRSGKEFTVTGLVQGKYTIEGEEVKDISGNRTQLSDFISRIEAVTPPSDTAVPAETPAAPGATAISVFLGLLAARYMLKG